MKPIVSVPNTVLSTKSKTVTVFDTRLTRLIDEMKSTLKATKNPKGVGLAAPQVGEPYRIFVTRPREKDETRVFINPEILSITDPVNDPNPKRDGKLEGCLSIPNVWGKVHRSGALTLRFQDEAGAWREEAFSGFLATIVQHETDHLEGVLFTQRVLEQHGKLYKIIPNESGEEELEEIQI